jgi:hypothetical protein
MGFLRLGNVRTSQETHLWASTAWCGDRFTFLYVGDVHTPQDTHLWGLYVLLQGYLYLFICK